MKLIHAAFVVMLFPTANAFATLPVGLKCDPKIKIVASEVGEVGKYEIQKGMEKEQHTALLKRKKVTPVDGCHFPDLKPGQTLVIRYTGEQVGDKEVQCIDLNNNNAPVKFPKSIYTVRSPNMSTYMMIPFCPDGVAKDGIACSKATSQSERGMEYQDTVLKWKLNDPKTKQYLLDLQFDPPYVYQGKSSVPEGAKLFCGLINRAGEVIIAGTAQYPGAAAPTSATETTSATTASSGAASTTPAPTPPAGRTREALPKK